MTTETPVPARRRWRPWVVAFAVAALVAGGAAAAVMALHARAGEGVEASPRPPLPVATRSLAMQEGYLVAESFAGRVEPARETRPAFERAGLVTGVAVEEGDRVAEGTVLARLDREPLEIERSRLAAERASVEADLALARRTADRRARLRDEGFETGQSFDEARFRVDALAARLETIDARLRGLALDLEKSVLTAPYAGEVAARMVDEGTVVEAGTPLLRLQETGRPQARIGVPPELAATLATGQAVDLTVGGREIAGTIVSVAPDLEPGTRTVAILLDIDPEARVTMGQVARLTLERPVAGRGAWVPLTALQEAERGLWSLHTAVPDGAGGHEVAREAVEVLHVAGNRAFVRGSFRDGARVVVEGPHRLTLGQPVAPLDRGEG